MVDLSGRLRNKMATSEAGTGVDSIADTVPVVGCGEDPASVPVAVKGEIQFFPASGHNPATCWWCLNPQPKQDATV